MNVCIHSCLHAYVCICRMQQRDWVLAAPLRKETAAETCLQRMRERLQSGCEACGCQNSAGQLQWHHHNETHPVEHQKKHSGIKRHVPWFKPTDNPDSLTCWQVELQRCTLLCTKCHSIAHQQHKRAVKSAEKARLQTESNNNRCMLESSGLVVKKAVQRAEKELRKLGARLE